MEYSEVRRDLFKVGPEYYFAHCISHDFALGAGIAVKFNKLYDLRAKLQKKGCSSRYGAVLIDRVFNLITKDKYWQKPDYSSLQFTLEDMRIQCKILGVKKLAMPKIGCGLDRLHWNRVSEMIQEVFGDTDIEILVCYL